MKCISKEQELYINDNWHKDFIDCAFINCNDDIMCDYQIWLYSGWGYDDSIPSCEIMLPNRSFIIKVNIITNDIIDVIVNNDKINIKDIILKFKKWLESNHAIINNITNAQFLYNMIDGEHYFYGSKIKKYVDKIGNINNEYIKKYIEML